MELLLCFPQSKRFYPMLLLVAYVTTFPLSAFKTSFCNKSASLVVFHSQRKFSELSLLSLSFPNKPTVPQAYRPLSKPFKYFRTYCGSVQLLQTLSSTVLLSPQFLLFRKAKKKYPDVCRKLNCRTAKIKDVIVESYSFTNEQQILIFH